MLDRLTQLYSLVHIVLIYRSIPTSERLTIPSFYVESLPALPIGTRLFHDTGSGLKER